MGGLISLCLTHMAELTGFGALCPPDPLCLASHVLTPEPHGPLFIHSPLTFARIPADCRGPETPQH